ncbi:hypothetical protein V6N13_028304 [Hibiscus sabdariffa]
MGEPAVATLQEMEDYGFQPSLGIYNSIIHAYVGNEKFDDSMVFLNEMKETGLKPEIGTYNVAMLEAYAKFGILDKKGKDYQKVVNSTSL